MITFSIYIYFITSEVINQSLKMIVLIRQQS